MSVTVDYPGRSGNNMFQYAFARQLALLAGLEFTAELPKHCVLRNTPNPKTGERLQGRGRPPVIVGNTNDIEMMEHLIWRHTPVERPIHCSGFFQKIEHYYNKPLIQSFFDYKKPTTKNTRDIVCHVRLTDYIKIPWAVHPSYYADILEHEEYDNIIVVTDDPKNDDYFRHLKKRFKLTFVAENPTADFMFLMGFDKAILSNSTFAWWAAYLGDIAKTYTFKQWVRLQVGEEDHIHRLYDLDGATPIDAPFWHEVKHPNKYAVAATVRQDAQTVAAACGT